MIKKATVLALAAGLGATQAQAQGASPQSPSTPSAPSAPAATQRVDINAGRTDQEERRNATATKIVIGRQEIEQFGDTNTLEILKRLPGITVPGAPGRGGPPRMRGLGVGYTQILMDGERVPPGFSLENVVPDQIERIEILRAPSAETGTRAIGGTINIVMREGFRKRLNDVRVGVGSERGRLQPGGSWTRNDTLGENWIYTLSLSAFRPNSLTLNRSETIDEDLSTGKTLLQQTETSQTTNQRVGVNVNGRLQWRDGASSALLMPMLLASDGSNVRTTQLVQTVGADPAPYLSSRTEGEGTFRLMRLASNFNTVLAGTRTEWRLSANRNQNDAHSLRREFGIGSVPTRVLDDTSTVTDQGLNGGLKASRLLANEHSLVSGLEWEANQRDEARTTLQNGQRLLADFGDELSAKSRRLAAYAQDEWSFNPQWSAYAGLRWEGINTEGDAGAGKIEHNRSSVWTPLLHSVYKFDPKSRDQIRVSLTRSYKSPTLQNLIARPSLNTRLPVPFENSPTQVDRAGNPSLKPELATGIDVAFERYLKDGGILSANLFHRNLSNYIRNVTALETVSWAPVQRWVSRPQNVGDAYTQGIELEAKFRVSDFWNEAPKLDIRSNLSIFNSKVSAVPGPNARLDEQPRGTANFGADYRIPGLPVSVGASLNFVPAYDTRVAVDQFRSAGVKKVWDGYTTLNLNPTTLLRLTASNFIPHDYMTGGALVMGNIRETGRSVDLTATNFRAALEFKL